jgi:tetratricopeptide (TPR) repeat protein
MKKQAQKLALELKAARESVERDRADPRHWISLGVVLIMLRHWDEAIKSLRRGLSLKPAYAEADARLFLAEALEGAGKLTEARCEWHAVIKMEPSYPSYGEPMDDARRKLSERSERHLAGPNRDKGARRKRR